MNPSFPTKFQASGSNAVARPSADKLGEVVSVKDFGTRTEFDGSTDNRSAIQRAIDAVSSAGGGTVYFPEGAYGVGSKGSDGKWAVTLRSNVALIGAGVGKTVVNVLDACPYDTPIFYGAGVSDVEIAHFALNGNKARLTSGERGTGEDEGINFKGGARLFLHHLYLHDTGQEGIDLDLVTTAPTDVLIDSVIAKDCAGLGLHMQADRVLVTNFIADGCGVERKANLAGQAGLDAAGMDIRGADCTIANSLVRNCARGICIGTATRAKLLGVSVLGPSDDAAVVVGSRTGEGGPVDAVIANLTASGFKYGILFKEGSSEVQVIGGTLVSTGVSGSQAIRIEKATRPLVQGVTMRSADCDVYVGSNVTSYYRVVNNHLHGVVSGVRLDACGAGLVMGNTTRPDYAGNAVDIRGAVSGAHVRQNHLAGASGKGVRLLFQTSNPSSCVITGNYLQQGITKVGTGHTIRDNSGAYVTEANGTATVANGTTSIAVTHGLNETPAAKDINVTPTNNLGTAAKFWISAVSSTTFTISVDVDPGATTATFAWTAGVR